MFHNASDIINQSITLHCFIYIYLPGHKNNMLTLAGFASQPILELLKEQKNTLASIKYDLIFVTFQVYCTVTHPFGHIFLYLICHTLHV